jgi:HlyD family secretion protein
MTIPTFLKRKKVYIPIVVLTVFLAYIFLSSNSTTDIEIEIIEPQTIKHVVSETGEIKAAKDISLSFANTGHVTEMYVEKGDKIKEGQLLAKLESGSESADLQQAVASLEREKVALQELLSPPTTEQLAANSTSLRSAETALENAKLTLTDSIANAYVKADDAINAKADQLFENPGSADARFGITIRQNNTLYKIQAYGAEERSINSLRRSIESDLLTLSQIAFGTADSDPEIDAELAESTLRDVQELLTMISSVLNGYTALDTTAQTIYDSYRLDISTARTAVNSALTSLRSSVQAYNSAWVALDVPKNELNSLKAEPKEETIRLQEIRIKEAAARVASLNANLKDSFIYSPIDGVVTDVQIDEGEVIAAGALAISIISDADLEISIFIPEDDFEFVNIGDKAKIQFDAYNNLSLDAEVVFVSPSAKVIDGVPAFEIILNFVEDDERIKPGLSVDVDIIAEETDKILSVPSRSILDRDGKQYVRILKDDKSYFMQEVVLGIRGEDGLVEVVSGLRTGDEVITFISDEQLESLNEIQ